MYNKIVLATDGSEHSRRATENAVHIASCTEGSKIEIVYVVDATHAKSDVLSNWNSVDVNDTRKARVREVEEMAKQARVNYEVKILHGEPGPTIVDYANRNKADVVIIGSRGLNGLQEFVLGSVSHKVAKRANCPVLIVK
ncbi:universal stress protein [Aquibacillus salsiterrae]|uniref:Universal stress protein n=1 Tax=Aquibacillus salsiterrae TaxID=2950439 RepID=A0A9X3WFN2_9BACI|nr:universal stress protein [Aquibacillus salsiterrae]MDC3417450.1 universal stress protein [Aquibacillus salsiterrae]